MHSAGRFCSLFLQLWCKWCSWVKLTAVDGEGCFMTTHFVCSFFNFCLLSVLLLLPRISSDKLATEPVNGVASVPRWKNLCALSAGCVCDTSQGWVCSNLNFFWAKPQSQPPRRRSSVTGGSHVWLSQPACVNKLKQRGVRITHAPSWLPY